MRWLRLGRIRPGGPPLAEPHNRGFAGLEDLQRAYFAGTLGVGTGGPYADEPRRQKARLTVDNGGGRYSYRKVQGTAGGGYVDDPADAGTCWEDNLTTGLPASVTSGGGSLVVELVWEGPAAEWRFSRTVC